MTQGGFGAAGAGSSRARRASDVRRRRETAGLGVLVLVLGAASFAWLSTLDGEPGPATAPSHSDSSRPGSLALVVRGAPRPLVALVVAGRDPAVVALPIDMTLELVGRGRSSTAALAELPGEEMRVALSNTIGAWIEHYAVMDTERLGRIVDHSGGMTLRLPSRVTLAGAQLGPGDVTLTGVEVAEYLSVAGPNALTRWEVTLIAILQRPPTLLAGDVIETDDIGGAGQVLLDARSADLATFPSEVVVGSVRVPLYDELDVLVADVFEQPIPPVPVVVLNGNGDPGVGASVAALLVPLGFRIVVSENADNFGHTSTEVIADGEEHVAEAQQIATTLGVGAVEISRVPSGIGDITIVIGRDFSS